MFVRSIAIDKIVEILEQQITPQITASEQFHSYYPFPISHFLDGLYCLAKERPNSKYLEVGSGIGTKLILAAEAGFKVTGIEINPEYFEESKKLIESSGQSIELIQVDAKTWNHYQEFDCIYLGGAFKNEFEENELEDIILQSVQPSTLLFWPLSLRPLQHGWHTIQHEVYAR